VIEEHEDDCSQPEQVHARIACAWTTDVCCRHRRSHLTRNLGC
jgi:hypothetical protein